ncbi:MAG: hypothetical protein IPK72_18035 [Candidatus Eisenbacteria bacterium]|nr:hypothetical protein [Candidatus Eisenbacteria bacterium]
MIQMERELRDDLPAELEKTRAEAQDRQETPDVQGAPALKGKLLSIRQDARGTIVGLADILFPTSTRRRSKRDVEFGLVKIATILAQFPEMHRVEGHTDNVGRPDYNLDLSGGGRRQYTIFSRNRGSGGADDCRRPGVTQPVADNATEEETSQEPTGRPCHPGEVGDPPTEAPLRRRSPRCSGVRGASCSVNLPAFVSLLLFLVSACGGSSATPKAVAG